MMLIAKGLPPERPRDPDGHDHLLAGMVFCFIGLAFLLSMLVLQHAELVLPGTVLVAIGLALLIDLQIRQKLRTAPAGNGNGKRR